MASNRESEREVAYPKISRAQLDLVIDQLLFAMRQRDLGPDLDETEQLFAYLTGFYTKRWGLPAAIRSGTTRVAGIPVRS